MQCEIAAADAGGARAAVGLQHVAIDDHLTLAQVLHVAGRSERPADQALDLDRATALLAARRLAIAEGHQKLAALRTAAGRHADAAAQWHVVTRIRSTDVNVWLDLARSLARADRKDEARGVLDELRDAPWTKPHRKAIDKAAKEIEKK